MSASTRSATGARLVPLVLAGAVVSISFAAIFFRLASPTPPLVTAGTRLAIASSLLLWATARAARGGRLPRRVVGPAVMCGLLYAVHFGAWVTSLTLTSVASSVTLVTATPLLLAVLSFATGRDRPERRHWMSIGLALVGLALVGWADFSLSPDALLGDGLALVGAAAMAFYLFAVRRLGALDVLAFSGITTLVGALALLGAAIVTGVPLELASTTSLFWVVMAALIPQLVGHSLLTWSLRHATPTAVGIATVGEPVGSTFLAWLWLDEPLTALVALGCGVTLTAVLLSMAPKRPASEAAGVPGERPRARP
jgi:drug/metabolite transporter (DMT)-like permease